MNVIEATIGILGITPEGAAKAYRDLTVRFYEHYGDYISPHLVLHAQPLILHVKSFGDEEKWTDLLNQGINKLTAAGARLIWIPANSSHLVFDKLNAKGVNLLNMVDISVARILASNERPLLLGTTLSISEKLYFADKRMADRCVKPNEKDQQAINDIIIKELVLGRMSISSKNFIHELVKNHKTENDITSVFFACTELPCFFSEDEFELPVHDSIKVSIEHIIALSETWKTESER